jgi:hypothetical protein
MQKTRPKGSTEQIHGNKRRCGFLEDRDAGYPVLEKHFFEFYSFK